MAPNSRTMAGLPGPWLHEGAGAKPSRQQFTLLSPALRCAAMQAQQFPEMTADPSHAWALPPPRRSTCAMWAPAAVPVSPAGPAPTAGAPAAMAHPAHCGKQAKAGALR